MWRNPHQRSLNGKVFLVVRDKNTCTCSLFLTYKLDQLSRVTSKDGSCKISVESVNVLVCEPHQAFERCCMCLCALYRSVKTFYRTIMWCKSSSGTKFLTCLCLCVSGLWEPRVWQRGGRAHQAVPRRRQMCGSQREYQAGPNSGLKIWPPVFTV